MEVTTGALQWQQLENPQNRTGFTCGGHLKFLPLDLFWLAKTRAGFGLSNHLYWQCEAIP